MSPSEATNAVTRKEWRELGFFYDVDEAVKQWRLIGSKAGLRGFAQLLRSYCRDSRHAQKSEHEHYGPYLYLKVMTWPDAGIDEDSVHGTIADLNRLAQMIEQKLQPAVPGERITISQDYATGCEYALVLEVRDDGFDPAEADPPIL